MLRTVALISLKNARKLLKPHQGAEIGGGSEHTANFRKYPVYEEEMARLTKFRPVPGSNLTSKNSFPPKTAQPAQDFGVCSYSTFTKIGLQSEPKVAEPKKKKIKTEFISILTGTITNLNKSDDLKNTIIMALNTTLLILSNV